MFASCLKQWSVKEVGVGPIAQNGPVIMFHYGQQYRNQWTKRGCGIGGKLLQRSFQSFQMTNVMTEEVTSLYINHISIQIYLWLLLFYRRNLYLMGSILVFFWTRICMSLVHWIKLNCNFLFQHGDNHVPVWHFNEDFCILLQW